MKNSYLTITDQFCGAGGSSQGARKLSRKMGGGLEIKLAMNHWKLAIETHNTNFPEADHDCADVQAVDPRRYQSTDILITSPECTNHSLAKGVKRKYQQTQTLFGDLTIDPSAERSRATMWDVPRFAEIHNYNLIIVENVVEARQWIMWDAWLHAMHNLGYLHKCIYLNSMHALPTPQSRDRMYVVFWKKGNKTPDLEFRPKAYCQCCSKEIESIQSWKDHRKKYGKYRTQYVYCCPMCSNIVEPYYYAAFNIIDWSIPGKRIGDRKKPLAANTMKRIEYGLKRHEDSSFIIYTDHSSLLDRSSGISGSMYTQATRQVAALVTKGSYGGDILPLSDPFITINRGQSKTRNIDDPLSTLTSNITNGVVSTEAVNAFLSYYYGKSQSSGIYNAVNTVPTKDRIALVMTSPDNIDINDCTYRMILPKEVQAAMAFEKDYIVCGSGKDKVRQLGNAVTPPAMEWLLERGIETFN
ncbi:MAG: DNA cytosine methyltransferase [Tannerella sp.]|jgi:DNA (cytosine-5)-methyltransferase 1|nr:DNA cytosine methyltransferase [Tannerella sp.]